MIGVGVSILSAAAKPASLPPTVSWSGDEAGSSTPTLTGSPDGGDWSQVDGPTDLSSFIVPGSADLTGFDLLDLDGEGSTASPGLYQFRYTAGSNSADLYFYFDDAVGFGRKCIYFGRMAPFTDWSAVSTPATEGQSDGSIIVRIHGPITGATTLRIYYLDQSNALTQEDQAYTGAGDYAVTGLPASDYRLTFAWGDGTNWSAPDSYQDVTISTLIAITGNFTQTAPGSPEFTLTATPASGAWSIDSDDIPLNAVINGNTTNPLTLDISTWNTTNAQFTWNATIGDTVDAWVINNFSNVVAILDVDPLGVVAPTLVTQDTNSITVSVPQFAGAPKMGFFSYSDVPSNREYNNDPNSTAFVSSDGSDPATYQFTSLTPDTTYYFTAAPVYGNDDIGFGYAWVDPSTYLEAATDPEE